jgi:lipoprotein-releasing system permease protein
LTQGDDVYKVLLCWRYLRTRYLAMVCIVSVMLGVATLLVVNSVMSGFSTKLRERLHGLLSDVIIEGWDYNGFENPEAKMAAIRADPFLNERVEAMTPTLEIFAMLQYTYNGAPFARPVRLIGIEPEGRAKIGGFAEHLVVRKGSPAFELTDEAKQRFELRRKQDRGLRFADPVERAPERAPGEPPPPDNPFTRDEDYRPECIIVGHAIAHFRDKSKTPTAEVRTLAPGDEVIVTTLSGERLSPVYAKFVVCDYFRSEMSEYDSNYVFVPLAYLQKLRSMEGRVTSIQVRLKDPGDTKAVVARMRELFGKERVSVLSWEDKQGPLLAAISIEKGILNVLLFMIIAVAGFGILAIFSMIVVEKTKDIGILKALGASNGGVMKIFLGYGLLLGVVGAVLGSGLGVAITLYINEIEHGLARVTGQEIFPRDVYYFKEIPTHINVWSVVLVNVGAVAIAVVFSILPALRAALLHPVRALRYE